MLFGKNIKNNMKLIYIAGKYRGKCPNDIHNNIEVARQHSIKLWEQGYAVVCPHLNTAFMDGACDDSVWLNGDLEILKRCDAIYMLPNWQESVGATNELKLAKKLGLEILEG
jgi:hypothetical protein